MENIFSEIVNADKLNNKFKLLKESKLFDPAKILIENIAKNMVDLDGNYIEQFQSEGFDSRLWEMYLFNLFNELGFTQSNIYDRPDFQITKSNYEIFIEASLSAEKKDDKYDYATIKRILGENNLELQQELMNYYIMRMGSVLFSKLSKKYWELEWVMNKPLIIAITPAHNYLAKFLPDAKLIEYLYGIKHKTALIDNKLEFLGIEHIKEFTLGSKTIPSNFFSQPYSENISGIIFTNNSDLHKFNRMSYQASLSNENLVMVRSGLKYDPNEDAAPLDFTYQVIPEVISEKWYDDVTLFHNPNAVHKIDIGIFKDIRQVWIEEDGSIGGTMPDNFIFNSITGVLGNL